MSTPRPDSDSDAPSSATEASPSGHLRSGSARERQLEREHRPVHHVARSPQDEPVTNVINVFDRWEPSI